MARGRRLRQRLGVDDEQRRLARRHRLGPQPVEHPAPGGGHQPGGGPVRDAVARPGARGGLHGIREGVLDEVEATELREEQGDQPPPLLAHRRRERLVRRHCGSYPSILIDRPDLDVYAAGSSRAAAMAASRSGSSTS